MKSWSSANSTVSDCVVVASRLQHHEEVAVVHLELGTLVGGDGVLHGELVQAELLAHRLELLVGRLVQADPHEAVRLAGRLERQLERQLAVAALAVGVDGAVHDHAAIFPHAWQAPPGMDPATHIAHLRGRRGPAARRRTARIRTPPVAHAARRGTAPRSSHHVAGVHSWHRAQVEHGPSDRVRFKREPAGPRGRRAARLVRGERARAWSRRCRRWTPRVTGPPGPASGRDRSSRAAWPRRRRCTAGTPSAGPSTRRWRSTASTSTSSCSLPWRPGDALARARHDPPARHRHRRRVARAPSGRRRSPSSTATPRATSPSAAAPSDLLLWAWNRVPVDDRFEVFGDPRCSTPGAPASRSDYGIGSPSGCRAARSGLGA